MKKPKRTGLLGGTFNPVHNGHIDLGIRVMKEFRLDRILFILSARPPHKSTIDLAPVHLRWKMLNEALKPYDKLDPSDMEIKRDSYSWTIDTLTQLKKVHPEEQFFFISGSEGFLKIKTWKLYQQVLNSTNFIVVMRNKNQQKKVSDLLSSEKIIPRTKNRENPEIPSVCFFSYASDKLDISSTIVREKIKKRESVKKFLNNEVKNIIEEYKLYE
ncbi:MAG: nicotinate-nucleotide adenylyltransferase [Acidobacteriota bacterium]